MPNVNIYLCLLQLIKPALYAMKYIRNRYIKYPPTGFGTPWVSSSGSLHNS